MLRFERERAAAVWSHRGPGIELALPFVGATRSDYLAAPRWPGVFEVPVDTDLPCWVPLVVTHVHRWTTAGLPRSVTHEPGAVTARWDRFVPVGDLDPPADPRELAGGATARWEVEGRSLRYDLDLSFERVPDAVGVMIPETPSRPLHVELVHDDEVDAGGQPDDTPTGAGDHVARVEVIDVDGIKEWRSFWSALPRVHQVDLEPAPSIGLSLRVTPALRVASSAHGHHYHDSLYAPLAPRVVARRCPVGPLADRRVHLDEVDLFHLHWPEWLAFDDLEAHRRAIAELADHDVPIVWTAHNLTPHDKRPDVHDPIYQAWADAAAAVIHHSRWGEARFRERYRFGPGTRHVVIPHGHFGDLWRAARDLDRADAEAELGLAPCRTRIGLIGAPRADKDVVGFLEAVSACGRDDLQVVCWSLGPDEVAPDDPRIAVAERYVEVDAITYGTRLASLDLVALPFRPDGEMLATGTAADVIGLGLGALVSDWPYLDEALGAAAIRIGQSPIEVAAALDALDDEQVEAARRASRARQAAVAWPTLAEQTLALFDQVVTDRPIPRPGR